MSTAMDEKSPPYDASGDGSDLPVPERQKLLSPEDGFKIIGEALTPSHYDREASVVVTLNARHEVLMVHLLSLGSLDHTYMAPREIYRLALLDNAAAIVISHTHPSGDPSPSQDDIRLTRRIGEAGLMIGIDFLDHLIIGVQIGGPGPWVSLARRGEV